MHYIVEPLSGKIFLMRKFQTQNYIYCKSFPIYSRVISNKHYHGNMPIPTKLVGSNFNCFNCIFIAATTESFADANKMNTKSLETLHEYNFKKYEDLHNLGSQIVILSNHQLTAHIKLIFIPNLLCNMYNTV